MRSVRVTVQIGYENHSVELAETEWKAIQRGKSFSREVESYYEGEKFTYIYSFNGDDENTLCVFYSSGDAFGDGFIGRVEDATVTNV